MIQYQRLGSYDTVPETGVLLYSTASLQYPVLMFDYLCSRHLRFVYVSLGDSLGVFERGDTNSLEMKKVMSNNWMVAFCK